MVSSNGKAYRGNRQMMPAEEWEDYEDTDEDDTDNMGDDGEDE